MKNKKHDNPKPIRIAIGNLQEIKGEKLSPCELSDYDQHRHVSFSPSRSIRFSYNEHIINFGVIKDIPFNRRKSNQTGTGGTSDEGKVKTFNHYCQRNERLMGRWHGKARIYQINENHWYIKKHFIDSASYIDTSHKEFRILNDLYHHFNDMATAIVNMVGQGIPMDGLEEFDDEIYEDNQDYAINYLLLRQIESPIIKEKAEKALRGIKDVRERSEALAEAESLSE